MSILPFQVIIEVRRYQARGPRSLPLGQRLGTPTPCLLMLGVLPFHYTGRDDMEVTRTSPVLDQENVQISSRQVQIVSEGSFELFLCWISLIRCT